MAKMVITMDPKVAFLTLKSSGVAFTPKSKTMDLLLAMPLELQALIQLINF